MNVIFGVQAVAKAKFQLKFYNYKSRCIQEQSSYVWNMDQTMGPPNPNIAALQRPAVPSVIALDGAPVGQIPEICQMTSLQPPSKRRRTDTEQLQPDVPSTHSPPSCDMNNSFIVQPANCNTTNSSVVQPANQTNDLGSSTQNDAEDSEEEELVADSTSVEEFYKYREFYNPVQKNELIYKFLDKESNFLGNTILYHFSKTQEVQKKLLCRLIIEHEMDLTRKTSNPFSIQRRHFKAIAKSIVKIFKGEEEDGYYEPSYVIASEDKDPQKRKKVNAKGSLVREYETYRTRVKRIQLLKTRQKSSKSSADPNSLARTDLQGVDLSILKSADLRLEDQGPAIQTWKDVFAYRRETAFALASASEIMNEYKILHTVIAPELILSDFSQLFGAEISGALIKRWPTFAMQIIKLKSKEKGVIVTLLPTSQVVQITESSFKVIDFTTPKECLLQNQIIYNDGKMKNLLSKRVLKMDCSILKWFIFC